MKIEKMIPAALILTLGLTVVPKLVHAGDGPPPGPQPPHSIVKTVPM